MVDRLAPPPGLPPPHLSPSPSSASVLSTSSPNRSRRSSDTGLETAAASVALFPGSGTLAAATVGALGSVAAVAAGGVAILGGGVAAAAFKFSPSLSGEGSMSKEERERRLEEIKKATEESKPGSKVSGPAAPVDEDPLATVLSARDNHR